MSQAMQPQQTSPSPDAAAVPVRARGGVWQLINRSGIVMVFAVLFATLSLTVPDFLTPRNIQGCCCRSR